uniref:Uncharacterized protein n=1 Tax=Arundo donax TaxID=35708 RepID=A0A0A8Z960_ARUDO
MSDLGPCQ